MKSTKTRRRLVRGTGVAALAGGLLVTAVGPAQASWQSATVYNPDNSTPYVYVRDCYHPSTNLPPNTTCTYQTTLYNGTPVHVVCQRSGQTINGDSVWDYIVYNGGEGFATDAYINTGYSSWIPGIDICQ